MLLSTKSINFSDDFVTAGEKKLIEKISFTFCT